MPQNPYLIAKNQALDLVPLIVNLDGALTVAGAAYNGEYTTLRVDSTGALITSPLSSPVPVAGSAYYKITAPLVVKATPGVIVSVTIVTGGTGDGTIHDCATIPDATLTNSIAVITTDKIGINWPCSTGITIIPGAGQVLAIAYE